MARGKGREVEIGSDKTSKSTSTIRRRQGKGQKADYGTIDGDLIRQAIEAVTALGGAVRFGYTSDGGAYAIGVYSGDDRWTEYCRTDDDLRDYLSELADSGSES